MFDYNTQKAKEEGRKELMLNRFIAGALTVFDKLDYLDLSLLIEDIEAKKYVWFCEHCSADKLPKEISRYISEKKDGTIMFNEGYDRDYIPYDFVVSIGDILKDFAGEIINKYKYFENFDINEFKKRKAEIIQEYKARALEEANILLISDNENVYKELEKYGFKNIDYFASMVRADRYFQEHKEELDKFHLILEGNFPDKDGWGELDLEKYLAYAKPTNPQLSMKFYLAEDDYNTDFSILSTGYDGIGNRRLEIIARSYCDFFDTLVGNMLINRILERHVVKEQVFKKHEDYINPNKLPLPTKKKELKILYCATDSIPSDVKAFESLGIDVKVLHDRSYTFAYDIRPALGEYDIIIARKLHNQRLISCNKESTEQCKDTGRTLTMLAIWDDDYITLKNEDGEYGQTDFGLKMKMLYNFGGSLAPDSLTHEVDCKTVKLDCDISDEAITEMNFSAGTDETHKKYMQNKRTKELFCLQTAVNLYNEALLKMGKPGIADLDFKTVDEFAKEYNDKYEQEQARIKEALAPIEAFDQIVLAVKKYLSYKNKGIISTSPNGLVITEEGNNVKIENIINGKTMCSISFSKEYFLRISLKDLNLGNVRVFDIQAPTKKGTLSPLQRVGVYTSKYEDVPDIPSRPDEKQANALNATLKKVQAVLIPMLSEVAESPAMLNYRRKNRRY